MRSTYKRMYVGEHDVRSGQSQGRWYRAERDADGGFSGSPSFKTEEA